MTIKNRLAQSNIAMLVIPLLTAGVARIRDGDLDTPIAYTEGLLEGVAQDEAARQRYLQTIYAKEAANG